VHPDDAARLGIADGDRVVVTSRRGQVRARVRLTERSLPGMVFGTFHFAEVPINELTNDAVDPIGKIPEYKVSAVRVEKCVESNDDDDRRPTVAEVVGASASPNDSTEET